MALEVPEEAIEKRSERVAALRTNLAHGDATDEKLARLPAWARLYIAELEAMALAWVSAGHGWTKGRAVRRLDRHHRDAVEKALREERPSV